MKVRLMLSCLCDAVYGEVGVATARVLESADCEIYFPVAQTCCGQPPFNAGDWNAARAVAMRTLEVFDGDSPVVVPSASCAAMVRHGFALLGLTAPRQCYELCEFIVNVLGRKEWGGSVDPRRVALHRACHGRMIGLRDQQRQLLKSIKGLEVVEVGTPEQCCGFGGSFSVTHGKVSEGIGLEKLRQIEAAGVDQVVSGDMGCAMHLQGLAKRHSMDIKFVHVAQVLAEALD